MNNESTYDFHMKIIENIKKILFILEALKLQKDDKNRVFIKSFQRTCFVKILTRVF